jgi:hypothetical protein
MPIVTFHIGMPKCATTTIQSFLAERATWLAAQGQVYEHHPDDRTRNQGNAAQLAAFAVAQDSARMAAHLGYFLRSGRDVVLSSEVLFDLWRQDRFVPLRDAVQRLGYELCVVVYLKRQDLWIESDFKQHVKGRSDWAGSFEHLLERRLSRGTLNYHRLLGAWAAQVGREAMTVVPLNPSQPQDFAVRRFLEIIGVAPPEGALGLAPQNVSPPAAMIEAARHIKAALLARGLSGPEIAPLLAQFMAQVPERALTGAAQEILSPKARRDLLDRCAASNAALAQEFLAGQVPFDPPEPVGAWVPLSERAVAILAEHVSQDMLGSAPEAKPDSSLIGRWRAARRGKT